jgi:hypothetical protein
MRISRMGRSNRGVALSVLWMGLLASGVFALAPAPGAAQGATGAAASKASPSANAAASADDEEAAKKAEWQDRYRALRNNAVRMRDNATKLRRAYGVSQHSNYPRGGARERFKQQVLDTERKADDYESQLAGFMDEARQNQIPPGWIYEVDDEPVDPGTPAALGDDEPTHKVGAPDGRNPAYYGQGDDADQGAADDADTMEDDRGTSFGDFNDDRDDQHRAQDTETSNDDD